MYGLPLGENITVMPSVSCLFLVADEEVSVPTSLSVLASVRNYCSLRPHHVGNTASRPFSEVQQRWV